MIFRLGIAGGIGSGKSTVCRVFNVLGVPVFSADDEGRIIMETDPGLKNELNEIVGYDLYEGGLLDRKKLASLIFNDRLLLESVNALVHPRVFLRYLEWCEKQEADYVIFEAAILFESGAEKYVDKTVAVTAPLEERIQRVMGRNLMSREEVMERVNNQMSEEEMLKRSDFNIDNSENVMIIPQVMDIHKGILNLLNK
ncbi:MAG: dephospho-CoA kinase [Bacteroidales bacterium]|jgi:dephospho-CoA kinase|nr:dephospho-CoA kinase [Bacteroidales bacterium]